MKIVLLNPPARQISEKKDIPRYHHMGLGYLASSLEQAGLTVKVIDAKLEQFDKDKAIEVIKDWAPDVLGVTAMTHEIGMAAEIASKYKDIDSGVITVAGGVHVTALPEETLINYPQFDAGIIGEGEISLPLVIEILSRGEKDLSAVSGVVFREAGGEVKTTPAERIKDLDSLPYPTWKYFKQARDYMIITSRGCPYACVFCMQALGREVRNRSPENVVREIEEVITERAPETFLFYDETFTLDRKRVHGICDLLIEKGLNKRMKWNAITRVDAVDKDLLEKLWEAGCRHIGFGVESGNEEILKATKKNITKEQARKAIAMAKEAGFTTETGFILGHPNESMETALETIDFAAELNTDLADLGIMVPYPGTEVRDMALNNRGGYRLLSENWAEYNKQLGNALELENLCRADLERLQLIGYLRLFMRNRRYRDFAKFVLNFHREMVAYLRNILRKRVKTGKSQISIFKVIRLVFSRSVK